MYVTHPTRMPTPFEPYGGVRTAQKHGCLRVIPFIGIGNVRASSLSGEGTGGLD